jgi:hypothetical protein
MKIDHSLTFPSDILHFSLVAPPSLKLCHILKAKAVNYIRPPLIERVLSRAVSNTRLLPIGYITKHSTLSSSNLSKV